MRLASLLLVVLFVPVISAFPHDPEGYAAAWKQHHITNKFPSDVRYADLKKYLGKLTALNIPVREVGRSYAGREIYQVEWGRGPLKVFMWSQMHGDEPTATSALMDMFVFLQKNRKEPWVQKIWNTITVRAVPMLNPDGSELYQRRNLQGIDINRDAIDLKTPEGRLLKQLRDDWNPAIGFNLHNQGSLTTAGRTDKQAAISLLVVLGDEARTITFGDERNQRIASAIAQSLERFIPGHIARYSDEWTPSAFGDNFSAWGTPTILIETGALHGKDEMFLVKMNFVAFMTALNSLATGNERTHNPAGYFRLPQNSSGGLVNFVFRRANIILPANPFGPLTADIAAITVRRRASFAAPVTIRSISEFANVRGLVEYDASGYNVLQRFGRPLAGELAEFYFYKRDRQLDWTSPDILKQYPPDAIFSTGRWIKGEKLFPQR
jgi:hypothetical protein